MNNFNWIGKGAHLALGSMCLAGTLWLAMPLTLEARAAVKEVTTGPDVRVQMDANWHTAHPTCTVYASTAACGTTPTVEIVGSYCYPATGTVDIAIVEVEDAGSNCLNDYRVRSVDGNVVVVWIDPE